RGRPAVLPRPGRADAAGGGQPEGVRREGALRPARPQPPCGLGASGRCQRAAVPARSGRAALLRGKAAIKFLAKAQRAPSIGVVLPWRSLRLGEKRSYP